MNTAKGKQLDMTNTTKKRLLPVSLIDIFYKIQ